MLERGHTCDELWKYANSQFGKQFLWRVSVPRRCWFEPWVRKILWRRKWQSTVVFLPGKSHGWRSLEGYSPWGLKSWTGLKWLNHHHHHQGTYWASLVTQWWRICQCRRCRFGLYVGKIPWRRKWQPTPFFLGNPIVRGAWKATVHGIATVGHDLVTKQKYTYWASHHA